MSTIEQDIRSFLDQAGIGFTDIQERRFPDEHWIIVYVSESDLVAAQSIAGDAEAALNQERTDDDLLVLTFRPQRDEQQDPVVRAGKGRLYARNVDQLIQLLEARSRTSDALPSLKYVEDPRASLAAVAASRHQLIYGRRGVGKTALMLEAKRQAEREGHVAVWLNAHVLRGLTAESAFSVIAENAVDTLARHGGTSSGQAFAELATLGANLRTLREQGDANAPDVAAIVPALNKALRSILREGLVRLFVFIDDFYLMPVSVQPRVLDLTAGILRDCDGWMKIASIERLTRPYEPSSKVGLELPHDASKIDLDVTLEEPAAAQAFLESVLGNYVASAGLRSASSIAKPDARGRLVLASGGVPRDYLNLFASSIVVARSSRALARAIGREDVARAAGQSARSKKRDLEQDVSSATSGRLLAAQVRIAAFAKTAGYTYFRIDSTQATHPAYELIAQLVDLRFAHLVESGLSDKHLAGRKFEAYILDLSEYSDVRLKRGLNILDLDAGRWTWRLTGQARTMRTLSGTQFRDQLRQSPLLNLDELQDLAF